MKKILIVAAAFLAMTTASFANAYVCNDYTDVANVRAGPSAQDYRITDRLDNGYRVIVETTTRNAAGYIWAKIRYNSTRYGYPSVESGWIDGGNVCWRN